MPVYEYACTHCEKEFESIAALEGSYGPQPCPKCGRAAGRIMSATPTVSRLNVRIAKNHRGRRRIA